MKIALISCYNEGEANSEYTKSLEKEMIAQGHSVEILVLPFNVLGKTSPAAQKQADAIIKAYAKRLDNFDFVSIHYEFLLFGCKAKDVLRRVLWLVKACKPHRFSIIFHNFPEGKVYSSLTLKLYKYINKATLRSITQTIFHAVDNNKGLAIVHTFRQQHFIKLCCPKLKTIVMPLRYEQNDKAKNLIQNFSKNNFIEEKHLSLPKNVKVISIVGTLHPHKDNISVIQALKLLPDNYHLFFFGGMHKLAFSVSPTGLPHIAKAQELVCDLGLEDRVHFMGYQETTEDFQNACLFSDYIVMPYMENGEGASASAYTALELCHHVFCSRNNCFEELNLFCTKVGIGSCTFQYDMGNYMELAEKIKSLPNEKRILENRLKFLECYSITENAQRCIGL